MQTDIELLRKARNDPEAFCAFYRRYARPVNAWLYRRVGEAETANDLTAETFAQALCSLKRFRGESEGAAVSWLFGIANNLVRQYYKRHRIETAARRKASMPLRRYALAEAEEIEARAAAAELRPELREALAELPYEQREAVVLRVLAELPYDDIASLLQCSPANVRMRVSRALRTMNTRMKGAIA